jgi:hypothetical protein
MSIIVFVHSRKAIHTVYRTVSVGNVLLTVVVYESDSLPIGREHISVVGTETDKSELHFDS